MADSAHRQVVLVVDDEEINISLLEAFLAPLDCEVLTARDGHEALATIAHHAPDLVLTDAVMPGMDGFELCTRLRALPDGNLLPVVMVTALNQVEDRVRALQVGANDFLAKPVDRLEVQARVKSLLRLKETYDELDDTENVIFALAQAVEAKDAYTEAHTERVAIRARLLGMSVGLRGRELVDLYRGCMIHDIGKIGIPDAILLKPGPLNEEEKAVMQQHPAIGEQIARPLRSAANLLAIIRHHHENFDGSGYPDGLAGNDIPLMARITAISDAYDAMINDRPYRSGMASARAVQILRNGAGGQWDPDLVGPFIRNLDGAAART